MGSLKYFNLSNYNSDILVETGTGIGNGLYDALSYKFKEYHSCEIEPSLFKFTKERFKNKKNVFLYNTDSLSYLEEVLSRIPKEEKIIFWLDAHFPGADYVTGIYNTEDDGINMPLTKEMAIIDKYRLGCDDVILIDDVCLLIPFAHHKQRLEQEHGIFINYHGLGFLDARKEKYNINVIFEQEGYIEVKLKDDI